MANGRVIPDKPLEFIVSCVLRDKIVWTYHVNMRMRGRYIPRESIVESTADYEIIEEYPEDKYLPSYLVYSQHSGLIFHMVVAIDVVSDNARIVTAHYPNPGEWEPGLRKRKANR